MESLSDRELEVFQLLSEGHATREIAALLHLSKKTVSCYQQSLRKKLNLKNATELVQHAVHWTTAPNRSEREHQASSRVPTGQNG
jgi:DNA-binding NarL/FixJ family response regulator